MPLSAMTVAGVSPSLLQIYTEIACKSLYDQDTILRFDQIRNNTSLIPISHVHQIAIESNTHFDSEPEDFSTHVLRREIVIDGIDKSNCASDPEVQAIVARLLTG